MRVKNLERKLRLTTVVFFATMSVVGWALRSSAQQGGGQQTPPAPPSPDAPVEQTRKNIQILKGLPERDLFPLMNFISTSMGVRCNFCHVRQGGGGEWLWESDDKPEKRSARRMMQMQMQLNQTYLPDFHNQRITCYTCHRGSTDPPRFPPLPLTQSGHESGPGGQQGPPPQAQPSPRPSPPTAEQILSRYVQAVGNREAVARLGLRVMRGTREASQGRVWPIELIIKEPDSFLLVATVPSQGQNPATEMRQGFVGGKGWVKNQRGAREAGASELADMKNVARYFSIFKIAEPFPQVVFRGRTKINDRDAYALEAKPAPNITERYFFDAETGLLVRKRTLRETVLNAIPEQIDYEDYRDVNGVKLPFTIRVSNIDTFYSSTIKLTEVRPEPSVADTIFKMPSATPQR